MTCHRFLYYSCQKKNGLRPFWPYFAQNEQHHSSSLLFYMLSASAFVLRHSEVTVLKCFELIISCPFLLRAKNLHFAKLLKIVNLKMKGRMEWRIQSPVSRQVLPDQPHLLWPDNPPGGWGKSWWHTLPRLQQGLWHSLPHYLPAEAGSPWFGQVHTLLG